ncbi:hypothetical protein KKG48_00690 [Patescibacteria group bacterium]|nr:hypothetical protein [Patescibacteria group bacterium]MCG2695250.1 hypothetical protein [Candidatus Parcubacteria bacterium]
MTSIEICFEKNFLTVTIKGNDGWVLESAVRKVFSNQKDVVRISPLTEVIRLMEEETPWGKDFYEEVISYEQVVELDNPVNTEKIAKQLNDAISRLLEKNGATITKQFKRDDEEWKKLSRYGLFRN